MTTNFIARICSEHEFLKQCMRTCGVPALRWVVAGEREFEPAMALKNPEGCEAFFSRPNIMLRRIDMMSDLLGLDRSRILRWNFAQTMRSTLWMVEDGLEDEAIARSLALVETARRLASA